VQPNGLANRLP